MILDHIECRPKHVCSESRMLRAQSKQGLQATILLSFMPHVPESRSRQEPTASDIPGTSLIWCVIFCAMTVLRTQVAWFVSFVSWPYCMSLVVNSIRVALVASSKAKFMIKARLIMEALCSLKGSAAKVCLAL